jgi:hypothetical protein
MTISKTKTEELIFNKHNGNIELLEFNGFSKKGKFKCKKCDYEWFTTPSKVATRTGCLNCRINSDRLNIDYIRNYIESQNCELIECKEYKTASSKIIIKFNCGHISSIVWNRFQQGDRCRICGIKLRSNKHRTTKEKIINFLKENELEFVDFPNDFVTQKKSLIRYKCNLGHITERRVASLFQFPTCNTCEFADLAILKSGSANYNWKGGGTSLIYFLRNSIRDWKKESMQKDNYQCCISRKSMGTEIVVHHLISFAKIFKEVIENNNFTIKNDISEYTNEELEYIVLKFREEHDKNLGVCIHPKLHKLFHSIYGVINFSPEDFYDFVLRIKNKEIIFE